MFLFWLLHCYPGLSRVIPSLSDFHTSCYLPNCFIFSIVTESLRSVMDNSFHNFHISSYLPTPFCCFYGYRVIRVEVWHTRRRPPPVDVLCVTLRSLPRNWWDLRISTSTSCHYRYWDNERDTDTMYKMVCTDCSDGSWYSILTLEIITFWKRCAIFM